MDGGVEGEVAFVVSVAQSVWESERLGREVGGGDHVRCIARVGIGIHHLRARFEILSALLGFDCLLLFLSKRDFYTMKSGGTAFVC